MFKANTTIIVGGKTFQAGQTVNGLSRLDRKWMSDAGYISETASRRGTAEPLACKEDGATEGRPDEQL